MSNPPVDPQVYYGLAQLLSGIDTDVFENGTREPLRGIGRRIRVLPPDQRRPALEREIERLPGYDWVEFSVELLHTDPTRACEFESPDDCGATTTLPPAVAFPVASLPSPYCEFVSEAARALCCPPDYIAVPLLCLSGAAIGASTQIEIKPGWRDQALLYTAVVAPSGAKKSPAKRIAAGFTEKRAEVYDGEYRTAMERYEDLQGEYEDQLADYRKFRNKRSGSMFPEARPKQPEKPTLRRTWVADATVEALSAVLSVNPRGVVLIRDELAGFLQGLNQYKGGRGADAPFFLSAWTGEPIVVDRKGLPEPFRLPRPFLSIFGGVQPAVLPRILGGERLEDGMAARFLFAYPDVLPQHVSQSFVPTELTEAVYNVFERLFDLAPAEDTDGTYEPCVIGLSGEAATQFRGLEAENCDRLNSLFDDDPRRSPIAKMPAQLARLTLIIHCVRAAVGCPSVHPRIIDAESVSMAGKLVDYFIAHTERVWHVLGEGRSDRQSRLLLTWMKKKDRPITRREIVRNGVTGIRSAGEADAVLKQLEETGDVKRESRRHTVVFSVVEATRAPVEGDAGVG